MYQMVHFVLPPCMIFSLYFFSLSISLSLLFSSPSFLSNPHPTLYLLRPHHLSHHVITKTGISLPPMRRSCFWSGRLVCLFVNTIPGKLLARLSRNINFWSISESWGRCTNSFSLFRISIGFNCGLVLYWSVDYGYKTNSKKKYSNKCINATEFDWRWLRNSWEKACEQWRGVQIIDGRPPSSCYYLFVFMLLSYLLRHSHMYYIPAGWECLFLPTLQNCICTIQCLVLCLLVLYFCFLPSVSVCMASGEEWSWPQSAALWICTTRSRFSDTRSASLSPISNWRTTPRPGWLVTTVTCEYSQEENASASKKHSNKK